jgi:hypothetical protein
MTGPRAPRDGRLISRERSLQLVELMPLAARVVDGQLGLRHGGGCGQQVMQLARPGGPPMEFTVGGLVAAAVRHLVTAHGAVLSGGENHE